VIGKLANLIWGRPMTAGLPAASSEWMLVVLMQAAAQPEIGMPPASPHIVPPKGVPAPNNI